jgi:uncharacterized Zn finger protein
MAEMLWKAWPDECPECGDGTEVLTDSVEELTAATDDTVRCVGCGARGHLNIYDGDNSFVDWQ